MPFLITVNFHDSVGVDVEGQTSPPAVAVRPAMSGLGDSKVVRYGPGPRQPLGVTVMAFLVALKILGKRAL